MFYREPMAKRLTRRLKGVCVNIDGNDEEFNVTFGLDVYNEDDIYLVEDTIEATWLDESGRDDVPNELVAYLEQWVTESAHEVWRGECDAAAEERAVDRWESRRSRYD